MEWKGKAEERTYRLEAVDDYGQEAGVEDGLYLLLIAGAHIGHEPAALLASLHRLLGAATLQQRRHVRLQRPRIDHRLTDTDTKFPL